MAIEIVMGDSRVHEPQRIEFLKEYLKGVKRAVEPCGMPGCLRRMAADYIKEP